MAQIEGGRNCVFLKVTKFYYRLRERFSTTFLYTLQFILQDMSRTSLRGLLLSTLLATTILGRSNISVVGIPVAHAQNQTAGQAPAAEPEQQDQEFTANLTGDSEVPPVTTNATGSA